MLDMINSSMGIVGVLFVSLILLLWTLLPFAVFGIKDRLDREIALLKAIRDELRKSTETNKEPAHNANECTAKVADALAPKSTEYIGSHKVGQEK
jgi:hypothetical protein